MVRRSDTGPFAIGITGRLVIEFDLTTTEELLHWLLSFGRHAEVISPPTLRAEMTSELAGMNALYRDTTATTPRKSNEERTPR